jgi:transposase-like protein
VERGGNRGTEAIALDELAINGSRSFETRPSASPDSPVDTLASELPIRTSPTEGLPPPTTKRWVVRRKAAVVAAVGSGEITLEDACRSYQLSEEEFLSWQRTFEAHGLAGLRVTRTQQYRGLRSARSRSTPLKKAAGSSVLPGV